MTRNNHHDSYTFHSLFSSLLCLKINFFLGQHHPLQHFDEVDSGKSEQPHHTKSDFAEMETTVFQWTNSETVAWAKRQGIAG